MSSGSIPINILPPGWTFIALIEPFLNLLIIGTVFSSALVPLLCVLLLLSTPKVRRQPIFIMNLFAVIAGIFTGAMGLQVCVKNIVSPPGVGFQPRPLLVFLAFILFLPVFIDCILAYRLYIVYPPRTTPKVQLAIIFTPVIVFKIVRFTNLIIFLAKFTPVLLVPDVLTAATSFQTFWDHAPYNKIEWIIQVFDNCWASGLFLWKVWLGRKKSEAAGMVPSRGSKHSSGDKLKNLFYLALSSFMFPCIFSIAQIILAFHNHDFFIGAYISITNIYVEIFGVLLATIWATKSHSESTVFSEKSGTQLSSIAYRIGGSRNHGLRVQAETSHDMTSSACSRGDIELGEFDAALVQDEESSELPKSRALGLA
ncbi:hypothetical protein MVEN_02436200 [Mycena venus]|uniref:Uncharacterized protein n=1 Tax=Mycena venus TaxID=2733690 RepID=A0A8H6WYD1_9AGAR|nr:hypothetical protein MVEN_02436200 [Mycena venus]